MASVQFRCDYNDGMATSNTVTEADILTDIVSPENGDLAPEAARALLTFKFSPAATKRIRLLLQKNNQGDISDNERQLLERYLRVGQFLDLLHAKAKLSLGSH